METAELINSIIHTTYGIHFYSCEECGIAFSSHDWKTNLCKANQLECPKCGCIDDEHNYPDLFY